MDVLARFVPCAKRAVNDIFANTFGGRSEPRVFPVMDRAGAVRGQMREPAAGHQAVENSGRAIAQQMRAIDQHDARPTPPGGANPFGALSDPIGIGLRDRRRGRVRIDNDVVGARQAFAHRKRQNLQPAQIQRLDVHGLSLGAAQGGKSRSIQLTQHQKRAAHAQNSWAIEACTAPAVPANYLAAERAATDNRRGRMRLLLSAKATSTSTGRFPMTTAAQELLKVFDALPAADQHEVAVAILRRASSAEDTPDAAFAS